MLQVINVHSEEILELKKQEMWFYRINKTTNQCKRIHDNRST